MVGGIGMALLEEAELAPRFGRVTNANLAEYLVPVCADVRELDAVFVLSEGHGHEPARHQEHSRAGPVRCRAGHCQCGLARTGKRMRKLPITPDKLLMA